MEVKQVKIKVIRSFYYQGKMVKAGEVITLPQMRTIELIAANKAELVVGVSEKPIDIEAKDIIDGSAKTFVFPPKRRGGKGNVE